MVISDGLRGSGLKSASFSLSSCSKSASLTLSLSSMGKGTFGYDSCPMRWAPAQVLAGRWYSPMKNGSKVLGRNLGLGRGSLERGPILVQLQENGLEEVYLPPSFVPL